MDLAEGNGNGHHHNHHGDNGAAAFSSGPSLSECLLTAADILNVQLRAKLVVLSSGHSEVRLSF